MTLPHVELRHRWDTGGLVIEAVELDGLLQIGLQAYLIPWSELRKHVCPRREDDE